MALVQSLAHMLRHTGSAWIAMLGLCLFGACQATPATPSLQSMGGQFAQTSAPGRAESPKSEDVLTASPTSSALGPKRQVTRTPFADLKVIEATAIPRKAALSLNPLTGLPADHPNLL